MLWIFLIFVIIIAPFGLLLHELGHVIPALLLKSSRSVVTVGSGRKVIHGRIGRFHIVIRLLFFHGGYSWNEREPEFTNKEKILVSISGPLFNGLIAMLLIVSPLFYMSSVIYIFSLFNGYLALVNLIPFCIKGRKSDGYCCLENLKESVQKGAE